MPVTKSAKKKLRKDKKRTLRNKKIKDLLKIIVKKAKKTAREKTIQEAIKAIDRASSKHLIHKNKAARLKSSLSKLLIKKVKKQTAKK